MLKPLFTVALALALILSLGTAAHAQDAKSQNCRLIIDAATGKALVREGPCDLGRSPCSTFKIPLAVMGYDAGILKNEHEPAWEYLPEYNSWRTDDQRTIDPTLWESISVVWYSQKLTRQLGMASFEKYVKQFQYGNQDVSGDPGKNNGLTDSWLMSSLLVSPDQQVAFLKKLVKRELAVSDQAYEMTKKILPVFKAEDGWTIQGKTGSGFQRKPDGSLNRKRHVGWFVGWATNADRQLIFAELLVDEKDQEGYGGLRSREIFIKALPEVMKGLPSAAK
ncbi:MAG: class D beta-lactamase [Verrucomicrobium sp.]